MSPINTGPTVALTTLGCKVNLYETDRIRRGFERLGFRVVDDDAGADVCIVNTCSVTCTAEAKSRKMIHKLARRSPSAVLVVTGCDVEMARIVGRSFPDATLVMPNADKLDLPQVVRERFPHLWAGRTDGTDRTGGTDGTRGRTRALVKVQDGCDMFCTYCSVPLTRGSVRSRPMDEVLAEVGQAAAEGRHEVVVTGVLVGSYGSDLGPGAPVLADLVAAICNVKGIARVRLSSIEPTQVTDELLAVVASAPQFCAHLHLPLQSGDNDILRAMNRPYTREQYAALCVRAKRAVPDIGITTDILVGFPGETEEAHHNTLALIGDIGFARAHVFRYSKRPTTPAALFLDHVPDSLISERAAQIAEAARQTQAKYAKQYLGRSMEVLVEPGSGSEGLSGYTPNYIRVRFEGSRSLIGRVVSVHLDRVEGDGVLGHLMADRPD